MKNWENQRSEDRCVIWWLTVYVCSSDSSRSTAKFTTLWDTISTEWRDGWVYCSYERGYWCCRYVLLCRCRYAISLSILVLFKTHSSWDKCVFQFYSFFSLCGDGDRSNSIWLSFLEHKQHETYPWAVNFSELNLVIESF